MVEQTSTEGKAAPNREMVFGVASYEGCIVPGVGASYLSAGPEFGCCGIRIKMSKEAFETTKSDVEKQLHPFAIATYSNLCVEYDERGFGAFSLSGFRSELVRQAEAELIRTGTAIKAMLG